MAILVEKLRSFGIGLVIVGAIWYLAYIVIDRAVMPNPMLVIQSLPTLLNHNIGTHFMHSMYRAFMGLFFSMTIGLVVGILAANVHAAKVLTPFLYFTYPIPRVALLPVIMLVFGLGDTSKIIMITLIVAYPIIIVVRDSVKDIPKETYNTLICLGATRVQMFFTVTLPWAASGVLSAMRISLGTAIAILFFTETYGTSFGMGFFILDMWQRINYVLMFAGIVVLSFTGFIIFVFIDVLEDVLLRWRK
ncbi:MAG: ABC transporter permease subunit [Turicibacter sp.]|nr:ABC transporter permease subunit [Turicibacter sp.]